MSKPLPNTPMGENELVNFLDNSSDFGFELRCVERLSALGFSCQHGGSYVDRVTNKPRQFDIRAQKRVPGTTIRLAVECKNLTPSFPLLIMCVPRAQEESFHDTLLAFDPDLQQQRRASVLEMPAMRRNCLRFRVEHGTSVYVVGAPVGKSCAQVGRAQNNSITGNDAEVFDKWSQALASTHDLADDAANEGERHKGVFMSLIVPIVIVPDGTLWQVQYANNGKRTGPPQRTDQCSFFIGRDYRAGDRIDPKV